MSELTIDVIIPTYKPDKRFISLLEMLNKQTLKVNHIIILNTEEKFFSRLVYGTNFSDRFKNAVVFHHSKKEFDHGNTRNLGVKYSKADIFIMMTQDAVPEDENLIMELIKPLRDDKIWVSYARQVANESCHVLEKIARDFNYPKESVTKGFDDIPKYGIKTFFCSNVCAAYKRSVFDTLGGFVKHTIFNEDMIYAFGVINNDGKIAYAGNANVIHSHNYPLKKQFQRNFDLGVSQRDYANLFDQVSSSSEGMVFVKKTIEYLCANKLKRYIPYFIIQSGFKFIGYKLGKSYRKLPKKLVYRFTMNKDYWRYYEMKKAVSLIDATKGYGKNIEKEGK